ncbi:MULTISPECIES: RidA family protein [Halomonadaceae]|jgi:reactive intermediate/imine deaminase|uniref:RidA family protein n=2 Tax=Vreelandella TaxID=3137766 RepID=A0A7Z0S0J4_9GAMM|nr:MULTISPECIES: RidA family protein [Halomonas]NYS80447.1 RidA family protein [Halomonas glaciei]PKH59873.1 reactive intermediate/imine deaminase [Halomonas sp. Choline-3u-9]CAD5261560.1 Reactive intermediate/imine deaminase [Halomonas sp. 156]CAD5287439.1 Reactive intermediate/imine deaminase [Halomonas sp. 113]CAD5288974.1 Reactive intermediate/imine deaminase [Halomonas sp. 59]|tara:strand:+ start:3986 stop:4375 length:390 start_codon:yes stop_codon:yes gene_type:complete
MSIKRYGVNESKGSGRQALPFAKATEADGWLYVSGQTPMVEGEVIDGGIVPQAHQAISNMISIVEAAGYSVADIMRVGVWLDDPRDFWSFNKIFAQYFGDHPPARACVQSAMVVDCKVEVDCIAFRKTT